MSEYNEACPFKFLLEEVDCPQNIFWVLQSNRMQQELVPFVELIFPFWDDDVLPNNVLQGII